MARVSAFFFSGRAIVTVSTPSAISVLMLMNRPLASQGPHSSHSRIPNAAPYTHSGQCLPQPVYPGSQAHWLPSTLTDLKRGFEMADRKASGAAVAAVRFEPP